MANKNDYETTIHRWYIDTRALVPKPPGDSRGGINKSPVSLPLLSTLPQETRNSINRFLRPEDKLMSLASALLKHTFIHRTAHIPWSATSVSRTPKPHGRPFWDPPSTWHGDGFDGLEFNVSHQAGLVILAGCCTPGRPTESLGISQHGVNVSPDPVEANQGQIRIGVDVTCTKEARRTPEFPTQAKLVEWVDTFEEMFSKRERTEMKERNVDGLISGTPLKKLLEAKGRRFYTFWALKEAYIKMVGEGLLADWLKKLEFVDVVAPKPDGGMATARDTGMKVLFDGKDVTDSVAVEMDGYEETFLFTMITRGLTEAKADNGVRWAALDIEKDIRPCAEGTCSCPTS